MAKLNIQKYPCNFILFYAISFMPPAIFNSFFPVYLSNKGYNQTDIGTLLAIGPLIILVAQPLWGITSDRARYKNDILFIITMGTALSVLLYNFSASFSYLIAVTVIFTTFYSGIIPIGDTIILESLERTQFSFGPIRMAGTIGYAVMAIIAGFIAQKNINSIFFLYAIIVAVSLIFTIRMPKVKGYLKQAKEKVSIMSLFRDKKLVIFLIFNLIISITFCFYSNFFPLYYIQSGADNVLLGLATFICSMSEIPFLIFADRILKKIGTHNALIGSAIVSVLRWILLFFITNPYINLAMQMLHGLTFIVFNYSMVTYINKESPKEFKATAQVIYTLTVMGIARALSGVLGGYLSNRFGIRQIFLLNTFVTIIAIVLFVSAFIALCGKRKEHVQNGVNQ